jgi:hypothetical protein
MRKSHRDPKLLAALEEYAKVRDVAKMTEEQRELAINFEDDMMTFINTHIGWMNDQQPKVILPAELDDTPPHLVHLTIVASLAKMSEYLLHDLPLNITGNTHIRKVDDYSTCHFCRSEVSDSPTSQRYKLKYSKKEKVKSDLFYVVCGQCLRFVKAVRNLKFSMTCIQRCETHASAPSVREMVQQLDDDREFVDAAFQRLKAAIAQNS